jgi:hypothetical protein
MARSLTSETVRSCSGGIGREGVACVAIVRKASRLVVLEASGRLPKRLIARRSAVRTAVARGGLEVLIA